MYSANDRRKRVVMNTQFLGLFVLFLTAIGFALPAYAGCEGTTGNNYRMCMKKQAPVNLDHPDQKASNFPLELREFKQVVALPEDMNQDFLGKNRGACNEANGWTGVRNATGSYGCVEYTSSQGRWKAVSHNSKAYKLFKLEPYVENGQRKSRWVLKVDHDEQRGLYAVNGSASDVSGARGGSSGAPTGVPQVDNTTQDLLKKASDLFRK